MLTLMALLLVLQAGQKDALEAWEETLYGCEKLAPGGLPLAGCEKRPDLGKGLLADLYGPVRPEEMVPRPPRWLPKDRDITVSDRLMWRGDAVRWFNAGNAAAAKEHYGPAAESYGRALARVDDGEIRMALGLSLLALGNLDEAAVHLAKSLELRPGNPYASAGLTRTRHLLALRAVPPALR